MSLRALTASAVQLRDELCAAAATRAARAKKLAESADRAGKALGIAEAAFADALALIENLEQQLATVGGQVQTGAATIEQIEEHLRKNTEARQQIIALQAEIKQLLP